MNLKIIRTADIGIQVDDYAKSRAEIEAKLSQYKAYISNEDERKSEYYILNTIKLRIY